MPRMLPFEYAVRNLGRSGLRWWLNLAGSVLVVLLVLLSAAFVAGMRRSLGVSGIDENVVLLGAGSEESIERSQITAQAATIAGAVLPGIRSRLGVPYISPEVHMALSVSTEREGDDTGLAVVRGVTPAAFLVHPQVRVVRGRAPEGGRDEIMLGQLAAAKLGLDEERLGIGAELWCDGRAWRIVGHFAAPHTIMDAEIWCPIGDLQALARSTALSCVVLTLDGESGVTEFADVEVFAARRLDLELVAIRENDYYGQLTTFFAPIRAMVMATAVLIALGGVLGGLNTMYAAFASRVRELGMLQVLGYRRLAVVVSLVQESVLTSALGALVATALGLMLLDGVAIRFSMGAFGLIVDGGVVAIALGAGLLLGVFGALPPAWRALRMPITESLRA